mgnify:CR=1 FL=1
MVMEKPSVFADGLKKQLRFSQNGSLGPVSTLLIARLRQTPATHLDGTAPRVGTGTHALGHGLLAELFNELLLELAHMITMSMITANR